MHNNSKAIKPFYLVKKYNMTIIEIVKEIEQIAPLKYQENYDNSGLIIGSYDDKISKVLICFDVTTDVIDEAIEKKCDLIISHHPLIFEGLKKINENSPTGRVIIRAIKGNIAIYAAHTNLDNSMIGVNQMFADKIGLINPTILLPQKGILRKLVTFCPTDKSEEVRNAIFNAGAGHIGEYDCCSFNGDGKGSFKASDKSNPYVGEKNKLHFENEVRIETIFPVHLEKSIIKAMIDAHPYEEVAYDVYIIENQYYNNGAGRIGEIEKPLKDVDFLRMLKKKLNLKSIRHNKLTGKTIKKVAICGGSGAFLINQAVSQHADILITSEFKYNHFIDTQNKIIIADIGHYESEHFAKELIKSILIKKFPKFAIEISEVEINPVFYL